MDLELAKDVCSSQDINKSTKYFQEHEKSCPVEDTVNLYTAEDQGSTMAQKYAPFSIFSQFISLVEDDKTEVDEEDGARNKKFFKRELDSNGKGCDDGDSSSGKPISPKSLLPLQRSNYLLLKQIQEKQKILCKIQARGFARGRQDISIEGPSCKDTMSDAGSYKSLKSDKLINHIDTSCKPVISVQDSKNARSPFIVESSEIAKDPSTQANNTLFAAKNENFLKNGFNLNNISEGLSHPKEVILWKDNVEDDFKSRYKSHFENGFNSPNNVNMSNSLCEGSDILKSKMTHWRPFASDRTNFWTEQTKDIESSPSQLSTSQNDIIDNELTNKKRNVESNQERQYPARIIKMNSVIERNKPCHHTSLLIKNNGITRELFNRRSNEDCNASTYQSVFSFSKNPNSSGISNENLGTISAEYLAKSSMESRATETHNCQNVVATNLRQNYSTPATQVASVAPPSDSVASPALLFNSPISSVLSRASRPPNSIPCRSHRLLPKPPPTPPTYNNAILTLPR